MGVRVRQKIKGKGKPWWVFINHDNRRRSFKVGDKAAANKVASDIRAELKSGKRILRAKGSGQFRHLNFMPRLSWTHTLS